METTPSRAIQRTSSPYRRLSRPHATLCRSSSTWNRSKESTSKPANERDEEPRIHQQHISAWRTRACAPAGLAQSCRGSRRAASRDNVACLPVAAWHCRSTRVTHTATATHKQHGATQLGSPINTERGPQRQKHGPKEEHSKENIATLRKARQRCTHARSSKSSSTMPT